MAIPSTHRSTTREMPRLSFRASFLPATVDLERRTIQLTWTTGARVMRGFYDRYYEELSLDPAHVRMERLQSGGAPLLNAHNSYDLRDVLGVVESAQLEPGRGTAVVRFDTGAEGEEAFRKAREGILRNVSVGYATYKLQKIEDGDATIPVYRAIDWEPHEISMVPIGADADAMTRAAGSVTNPCDFIEERAMPEPEIQTTPIPAAPPAAPLTPPAPTAEQVRAAERDRVLAIQRIGRTLGRPAAEAEAAVNSGATVEAFRTAAVDALAAAPAKEGGVIEFDRGRVEPGEDQRDKWMRGAGNWIVQRAALSGIVAAHARQRGETIDLDPGEFRGLRLIDLARQSLERAGVRTSGMLAQDLIGKAFTHRSGGMATTGDFPLLLENVLHKILLAQYAVTPDTWTRFCSRGTVTDFKAHKRYRMGTFGALTAVNEHGEFTNKSISDAERESMTASTKGNIIGITRQTIINDDMGAFSSLATQFGRAAKLAVEVDVYALLAQNSGLGPTMSDSVTLFHADHANLTTGAALSAAALDLDRVAMGIQEDVSGNELLDLSPSILVVAKSLGGQARVINDSLFDPDTVANKGQNKANIAGKMFNDIVDTGRITGTRRYLFADPGLAPTIEVAFLDGQEMPFMEMKEGWRVDGVEWKVRLDYGVAAVDYRGAVTNAGV